MGQIEFVRYGAILAFNVIKENNDVHFISLDFIPGLTLQIFKKIDGYMIRDLKNNSKFPGSPDDTKQVTDFDEGKGLPDESYGAKLFGYFKAPQDGAYTFYVCE